MEEFFAALALQGLLLLSEIIVCQIRQWIARNWPAQGAPLAIASA